MPSAAPGSPAGASSRAKWIVSEDGAMRYSSGSTVGFPAGTSTPRRDRALMGARILADRRVAARADEHEPGDQGRRREDDGEHGECGVHAEAIHEDADRRADEDEAQPEEERGERQH